MSGSGRSGPKPQASKRPLPQVPGTGADHVINWCERFVIVPKGRGAKEPLRIRPWQAAMVRGLFDPDPRPTLALWQLPRGCGKTTLAAALCLYCLHADGVEGARVALVAVDERQAQLALSVAARATALHPSLDKRTTVYRDRLIVPRSDSWLMALPAEAPRLEGLDLSFALVDEVGFVPREVYETVLNSTGKRERSTVLCIGTPSPPRYRDASPMADLLAYGVEHPGDESFALAAYGAAPDVDITDEAAWHEAVPALGDLLTVEHMRALMPPKMRPNEFRRARLGAWVDAVADPFIGREAWGACARPGAIPDGAEVCLAFDGSFSADASVVVACTVDTRPHVMPVQIWEPPPGDDGGWRVPVADVEGAIRDACRRWTVVEVAADPFRWTRSLQALASEGLPMVEHPQSTARMAPITAAFREAVVNGAMTHADDPALTRHVLNAQVKTDARGERLSKDRRNSSRRIDAAVAATMAFGRAQHHAHQAKPRRRAVAFF